MENSLRVEDHLGKRIDNQLAIIATKEYVVYLSLSRLGLIQQNGFHYRYFYVVVLKRLCGKNTS